MQSKLIIAAVILSLGFGSGWMVNGWRLGAKIDRLQRGYAQAAQEAADRARSVESAQRAVADAVAVSDALKTRQRRIVERIVTNEVIKYVQKPAVCTLPADWVRIHNTAARGVPGDADTPPDPDGGAGTPEDSVNDAEALVVVTQNYDTCRANADRLRSLQDWIRRIAPNAP